MHKQSTELGAFLTDFLPINKADDDLKLSVVLECRLIK